MKGNIKDAIAVSFSEYNTYGCINCGCEYCFSFTGVSGGWASHVKCGECEETFIILSDGLDKSNMGFSIGNDEYYYPVRSPHPRLGLEQKHRFEAPDERPEKGEFFKSRGVGFDLAGFVKCKKSGERLVNLFKSILGNDIKTFLDFREKEPTWIQVKVQPEDGIDLHKLHALTIEDEIITYDRILNCLVP